MFIAPVSDDVQENTMQKIYLAAEKNQRLLRYQEHSHHKTLHAVYFSDRPYGRMYQKELEELNA
jgi:hypothetical protein